MELVIKELFYIRIIDKIIDYLIIKDPICWSNNINNLE